MVSMSSLGLLVNISSSVSPELCLGCCRLGTVEYPVLAHFAHSQELLRSDGKNHTTFGTRSDKIKKQITIVDSASSDRFIRAFGVHDIKAYSAFK